MDLDVSVEVKPSRRFWEYDLALPFDLLVESYSQTEMQEKWLNALTSWQVPVLYSITQNKSEDDLPTLSVMRQVLLDEAESLLNYYLVNRFARGKLEKAVIEIAEKNLDEAILTLCLDKNGQYDKKSLLFALCKVDPEQLKHIGHYNKIHKRGFAAFTLPDPPRQRADSFADSVFQAPLQSILNDYDQHVNDGVKTYLLDVFFHEKRLYIFALRASDEGIIMNRDKLLHGHKPNAMIFDFNEKGNCVGISDKKPACAVFIANALVSRYFQQDLEFVPADDGNFEKQIVSFITQTSNTANGEIKTAGIGFKADDNFHCNTEVTIYTSNQDPFFEEWHKINNFGDLLSELSRIQFVKIYYQQKSLTLYLKYLDPKHIQILYNEHVLDKSMREAFKTCMEEKYGLKVLPRSK